MAICASAGRRRLTGSRAARTAGLEIHELGDFIREVEGLFDPEFQMKLHAFRARERALDGEIAKALDLADRAVGVAETTDQLIFHAEVLRDRADILAIAARPSDAAVDLEQAIQLLEAKGNAVAAAQARAELAEVVGVESSSAPRPEN